MGSARICYTLTLVSGGLWGTGAGGVEADVVTARCRHASGREVPCIPNTYIKGILRRALEEVADHLTRTNIIRLPTIIDELFGPLTPFSGRARVVPANLIIATLYPIRDFSLAKTLSSRQPLSYLYQDDAIAEPTPYIEPHIRIDDRTGTVSTGALYRELRIAPGTTFYGEILYYSEDRNSMAEALRALAIAIGSLRTRSVGRRTYAKPYIVSATLDGEEVRDEVIGKIVELLQAGK